MTKLYELQGFLAAFDDWIMHTEVSVHRRVQTYAWVMTRVEHPYEGARREGPDYWFATVPRTASEGQIVVCSFWIFEKSKTVKCDNFGILSLPV